jgi:hypothetical protein
LKVATIAARKHPTVKKPQNQLNWSDDPVPIDEDAKQHENQADQIQNFLSSLLVSSLASSFIGGADRGCSAMLLLRISSMVTTCRL